MVQSYELRDGFQIPKIGFGTYELNGVEGTRIIENALLNGYRLIDTAFNYENEGIVGKAIKNSSIPRDQITVTSKLPGRHQQYKPALRTIQESIARLGLDYVDLYLIHWPNPKQGQFVEAWQALIDSQKSGLIRSIGVCNFLPEHIDTLELETGVLPVINQIELHPRFNQQEQRKYDESKNIITQSWSPLGRAGEVLANHILVELSHKYQKTVSQIILRWHLQLDALPIPKSSKVSRQIENIDIFDFALSAEDMQKINSISSSNGRIKDQDPAVYEEF
ncbi:aldo/keto reductase [Providencia sneebia]|uniref:Putative 2,5-diketo-D-gluconate reductase n=1 Tax=Providencia sneebia DSM 19967 TaxID=1141660 RepID=K8W5T6_9GAMM|nr:aldo/keto reductase [Providencia sneebia]EKT55948.1 putative 2,5-diketo-D-gluconate reductase [Providencia sneebia DSM 19967]